jgi:hypothetical protein
MIMKIDGKASLLQSVHFRRCLFFVSGVPRFAVKFAESCTPSMTTDEIQIQFEFVWQLISSVWFELSGPGLVKLVAHALSGAPVVPSESPEIVQNCRWSRLADEGYCLLTQKDEFDVVSVPYSMLRLCSYIIATASYDKASAALIQNLQYLRRHVDDTLYDIPPWDSWEKFGACFHALRINALQVTGVQDLAISHIFAGAKCNVGSTPVSLEPVKVFWTGTELSPATTSLVEKDNSHYHVDWPNFGFDSSMQLEVSAWMFSLRSDFKVARS